MDIASLLDTGLVIEGHNPTHGYNCICMDQYIRNIRSILSDFDANTQARLRYILQAAARI